MGTPRVRYRAGGGHDHIHVLYAQGVLRRLCAGVWGRAGLGGDGLGVLTLLPGEEPQHILAAGAEETENDAEQTVDTPHATRSRRPPEHVAAPVERAVAAGAPGAQGGCVAGGGAAPHPVGHGPRWASDGPAVSCCPDLVHAAGALLGTPGAVLAGAGAHGRGGRGG